MPEAYSTPAGGRTARERAALYAEARQEREDETGELFEAKKRRQVAEARQRDAHRGETSAQYFRRFIEHRTAIGKVRRARDLESCWKIWIAPKIGPKLVASITRDDAEDVRDALDRAVAARKKDGGRAGLSGAPRETYGMC